MRCKERRGGVTVHSSALAILSAWLTRWGRLRSSSVNTLSSVWADSAMIFTRSVIVKDMVINQINGREDNEDGRHEAIIILLV